MTESNKTLERQIERLVSLRRAKPVVDLGPLALPSVFEEPRFLLDGQFCYQIPVLFWLTEAVRPTRVVCHGKGAGEAFLAICQVVDQLALTCACSWRVDESPSDEYESDPEHVLSRAKQVIESNYSGFASIQFNANSESRQGDDTADMMFLDLASCSGDTGARLDDAKGHLSERGVLAVHGVQCTGEEPGEAEAIAALMNSDSCLNFSQGTGLLVCAGGGNVPPLLDWLLQNKSSPEFWSGVETMLERIGEAHCLRNTESKLEAEMATINSVWKGIREIRNLLKTAELEDEECNGPTSTDQS